MYYNIIVNLKTVYMYVASGCDLVPRCGPVVSPLLDVTALDVGAVLQEKVVAPALFVAQAVTGALDLSRKTQIKRGLAHTDGKFVWSLYGNDVRSDRCLVVGGWGGVHKRRQPQQVSRHCHRVSTRTDPGSLRS